MNVILYQVKNNEHIIHFTVMLELFFKFTIFLENMFGFGSIRRT